MSIPAGLVNALVAWAGSDTDRIAQLTAERDALVTGFLSGGKDRKTMISGSANGKAFTFIAGLSQDEKLTVLTAVLTELGVVSAGLPNVTYGNFFEIRR